MAASQVSDLPIPTIASQDPEADFQPKGDWRPPRQDEEWRTPPEDRQEDEEERADRDEDEEWENDEARDEDETPCRYGCRQTPSTVPMPFRFHGNDPRDPKPYKIIALIERGQGGERSHGARARKVCQQLGA